MQIGKLKTLPEDFLVAESMLLPPATAGSAHHYYLLRKCEHTTFEALALLASHLGLPAVEIGYAGLKDEDGVTEQYVSLPVQLRADELEDFNVAARGGARAFVELFYVRPGGAPLRTGELAGNNFRVVVRALPAATAAALAQRARRTLFFVNYYGTQRFGLPGRPKLTHHIGKHLIEGDVDAAHALLKEQGGDVGARAARHRGSAAEFLAALDPRQIAFYQSAHHSFLWNEGLKDALLAVSGGRCVEHAQDGIVYLYPEDRRHGLELLAIGMERPYTRVQVEGGALSAVELARPVLVQASMACHRVFEDDLHAGQWAAELGFFLPSGCYATVAIPQLLAELGRGAAS
ncbi:tRNA pseudouridine(13) synthase TruD [Sorangium sp. So ce1128]